MDKVPSSSSLTTPSRSTWAARFGKQRRTLALLVSGMLLLTPALFLFQVSAASGFASPLFQQQWQQGEAVTPNYWGPLSLAKDGQQEPYVEAPGGQRLVQYFDKARMELTNPATNVVTNGLLAVELITGNRQLGDSTFQNVGPANVPVAGDPDNIGPTYAAIQNNAAQLRVPVSSTVGASTTVALTPAGALSSFPAGSGFPQANIAAYDGTTQHNVPAAFATFRNTAGLLSIGFAISEPFWSNVKVANQQKDVLMQAFERRVLTFTPSNPVAFQVEFGNIGIHYFQWRYVTNPGGGSPPPSPTTTTTPTTPAATAPTLSSVTLSAITTTGVTGAYTTNVPACGTLEYRVAGTAAFTTDIATITCGTPAMSFTKALTGLTAATNYEVRGAAYTTPGAIGYSAIVPFTTLAVDTTAPTVSAIAFTPVDKNNMKVTFTLNEAGTAKVKYGTAADLTGGTTIDATGGAGNTFQATFGITRETQYYYQITATDTAGNSASTLVKQVRLDRNINVNLKTLTIKTSHFQPPSVSGGFPPVIIPECDPTYSYVYTLAYASGTPSTKTFNFTEPFTLLPPTDQSPNHSEFLPEDVARAIKVQITGTYVGVCNGALAPASVNLASAQDFSVGSDVIVEGVDFKGTFAVTDTLTPVFTT